MTPLATYAAGTSVSVERSKVEIDTLLGKHGAGQRGVREFLADLMLPNGETAHQTIGAYMQKLIQQGYQGPLALPPATTQETPR